MLEWFVPNSVMGPESLALLLFRIAIGTAFLLHGRRKLKHPTDWMQEEGAPPSPPQVQYFAALTEFSCGAGYLLGLFSPLAAIGMLLTMAGAILTVHIPKHNPFVNSPGKPSAESSIVYAAAAILLLVVGPGTYSVDQLWTSIAVSL
jgi:putative oxidoreductase